MLAQVITWQSRPKVVGLENGLEIRADWAVRSAMFAWNDLSNSPL